MNESLAPIVPAIGKRTFFLIDLDQGVVVGVWASDEDTHSPNKVKEVARIASETGHRYTIAKSTIFIEPPR